MDTHMTPALHGTAAGVDLKSYCDHASIMRESADITRIAPALVRAQAAIENPLRNRSVQVRTQAGSYQFRYATLDRITDAIRPALADNGLCVLQPIVAAEKGPALVTRLLHESGQWMECEIMLPALGSNPQGFGSAITYLRRYSISAMLNITADEDDDGNRAAGNQVRDLEPVQGRGRQQPGNQAKGVAHDAPTNPRGTARSGTAITGAAPSSAETTARALVGVARTAETIEEGHALLEAWLRDSAALEGLRGTRAWEGLEREVGAGLKRSLGTDPAAAFVAALRAADASNVAALQEHWEGRWADTLAAMQQEAPATYALLRRHAAAQVARVRGGSGGTNVGAAGAEPSFESVLRDEAGEAASDPIVDPVAFARAYANQWRATDEDARSQLARHNIKALAAVARTPAARAVLDTLGEEDRTGARPAGPGGEAPLRGTQPNRQQAKADARASQRRKGEPAAPSNWTILRPGKAKVVARDGQEWLAWWKDAAARAVKEAKLGELDALYQANTGAWDQIATGSAEAHDFVAAAADTVRAALEG